MAKKKRSAAVPETTTQRLGSLIKSTRNIMRKDKGLNGDLDRLPQLTWIMFLKFLDDMELMREQEAELSGERFRAAIDSPYRWRDWAAQEDGITGEELLAFVNQDDANRPDGSRGDGLFKYLRELQSENGRGRRDVIGNVFSGALNRMINGYLLRDVINKINGMHFNSSEEVQTLGHLYETMLQEMRDAAGDSGEFYTPRPVVQFMVQAIDPKLHETTLDPACGTGGFLCAAYGHMAETCETVEDRRVLQEEALTGQEAKPMPYMLSQMNLLLHGLEFPNIAYGNSLAVRISEIGDSERVNVILTNPPFGGEEELGIRSNFPNDLQTAETALLFLQLIMRKLQRPTQVDNGGRAAVVVPNGTLYASGAAARIRQLLIDDFNLHTIVRLPKGVFEPYADIPTNILFFERSAPTDAIWFYEHPLPPNRAALRSPCYSMTESLVFEEFLPLLAWWNNRIENEHAWQEKIEDVRINDYNLDCRNPYSPEIPQISLEKWARTIDAETSDLIGSVKSFSNSISNATKAITSDEGIEFTSGTLDEFCQIEKGKSPTKKTEPGRFPFVVTAAEQRTADHYDIDRPAVCIPTVSSTGHGHASINRIHYAEGKFALANIMAAISVKPDVELVPKYLYYFLWVHKEDKLVSLMAGTANTSLTLTKLKTVTISFPSIDRQRTIVAALDHMFQEDEASHIKMVEMTTKGEDRKIGLLRACIK